MSHKTTSLMIGFTLILLLMGLLVWAGRPAAAQADNPLPPRDTPTPVPTDKGSSDKGGPVGSYIELVAPSGAWAVVQWHYPSDGRSTGGWQNVEGWQGAVTSGSRWWVHPKDFGTGPFRWRLTQESGGAEWGVSEPFNLPAGANETLRVTVTGR